MRAVNHGHTMGGLATISVAMLILMSDAGGIVIRHDVPDSEYQEFAEEFSQSLVYLGGCAATLIETHWAVTAAHCLVGREDELFEVQHLDHVPGGDGTPRGAESLHTQDLARGSAAKRRRGGRIFRLLAACGCGGKGV